MPIYGYRCLTCDHEFDLMLPASKSGDPQPCANCGEATRKQITAPNFNLVGDDWPGKANRVRGQMAEKNRRISARQTENHGSVARLVPNVDGERVESWSDARKLAKDKGKDTSSYDRMVSTEKKV
jgi:putative FmdB family regulatory protein